MTNPKVALSMSLPAIPAIPAMAAAAIAVVAVAILAPAQAGAQGIMIPTDTKIPALNIESHRVTLKIKDGVAKTTVEQVFRNDCSSQLEATYIFPLPGNAAVSDFSMWMGGKKVKGEILEKDEAAKIYQSIVSKMKDPGLLEYLGNNLFQAKVFPVPANGTQKVEISFTSTLEYQSNMYKYVYPLRTSGPSAKTMKDFTFTGTIKSDVPIKTVYSPTHEMEIQVDGDKSATIGFEKNAADLDRDLVVYYTVSEDRIGLSFIAHRVEDEDGTFMLLLAPGSDLPTDEIVGKQVTFVLDSSGSMSGEKMDRAKKALAYCLDHLNGDDLFNVIRFSSTVEPFFDSLVPASKSNVSDAKDRVDDIMPLGGTAIEPVLRATLKQKVESGMPHFVLFITDGMPTVGETDPAQIVKIVTAQNSGKASLFAFGVGDDVNVNFLDKLAVENHGSTEYARTGGDLEMALSTMYAKLAYPALTDIVLAIDGAKTKDVFPQDMPDLFYGGQVVVVGRFDGSGSGKVTIEGNVGKDAKKLKYKVDFPKAEPENDFIEHIWATRKVGYLLDQIRLNGESAELKDEVIAVARRYGIVTPYTSYLIVEEGYQIDQPGPQPWNPPPMTGPWIEEDESWVPSVPSGGSGGGAWKSAPSAAPEMSLITESAGDLSSEKGKGESAFGMGKKLKDMKTEDKDDSGATATKWAAGKSFMLMGGRWVDGEYASSMDTLEIKWGSDSYFDLLALRPDLKDALSLGTEIVIVTAKNKAIVIGLELKNTPSKSKIEKFVGK